MNRFPTFEKKLHLKDNSFGALRLFLALAVLYHHLFPLGGFGKEPIADLLNQQETVGSIAVLSFFIMSGFLVTNSFVHSQSVLSYGAKRALRIYPAFLTCLIVTAFLFAPLVYLSEVGTLDTFWSSSEGPISYITQNMFFFMHQYNISGLLSQNPYQHVFDGSLWTLILEVKAYIILGILGVIGLIKRRTIILFFYLILIAIFLTKIVFPTPSNNLLHFFIDNSVFLFLTYFFTGVIFYLYRKEIIFSRFLLYLAIGLTVISIPVGIFHQILPFTFSYILFWLAAVLPLKKITRYGDFSYGIYIYAFPIQQLLTHFKLHRSFGEYLVLSTALTVVFAVLSWYLVEKEFLSLKKTPNLRRLPFISYLSFLPFIKPIVVPKSTAKSDVNWSKGRKKKAR